MKSTTVCKVFVVGFLTLGVWGCGGGSDLPPLGQVSGIVTLDGQPLEHAQLIFQPENGRPSVGETDSEGNYELVFTGTASGALLGPHKVVITSAVDAFSDETGEGKDRKARPEVLPAKYHSKTTLTAVVEPGSNQIDFPLTSK
ncbi:hypothetical protein [uncultured Gimesia sp.]|uniref:hypothetical protein n=1 Tax=uncultured Gimesia sp. TaxID=1678688 RepID=UPI0030D7C66C|tara:strand:- start:20424 stop:20852 length:429 start_codon:yes stop_codon:yes gene_type:complete